MAKEKGTVNILIGIIFVLLVIIAVMGFFLGRNMGNENSDIKNPVVNNDGNYEDVTIKVIKDSRDSTSDITAIIDSLKDLPSLSNVDFNIQDFSEDGIKEYMQENNIQYLPAIIFSTNNFDVSNDPAQTDYTGAPMPKINEYLEALPNGEYSLSIGARYNPFIERSENGFLLLTQEKYDALMKDVYIDGNPDAKIAWLEYSDLQCSYCAKLYTDGTPDTIKAKYGDDVKIVFNHFPIFAPEAAEALECIGAEGGDKAFYTVLEQAFADRKADTSYLTAEAVKSGLKESNIKACLDADTYVAKVDEQMKRGQEYFGITGTPGNIIINTETLEYEELSGAYPAASFEAIIDKMLN